MSVLQPITHGEGRTVTRNYVIHYCESDFQLYATIYLVIVWQVSFMSLAETIGSKSDTNGQSFFVIAPQEQILVHLAVLESFTVWDLHKPCLSDRTACCRKCVTIYILGMGLFVPFE